MDPSELDRWNLWAELNPYSCPCRGGGWLLSDFDTWHACGLHPSKHHPEEECSGDEDEDARHAIMAKWAQNALDTYIKDGVTMEAIEKETGPEASLKEKTIAGETLWRNLLREQEESEAQRQGYSCALEMRWDLEWHEEEEERSYYR